jgi:outer membrane protein OmpA-like peptidoglycan-associated protein
VTARLREREQMEQRFREAQALFSPEEGEVLTSGDKLVVRLHGFTFPVGSAEIRPEDYSLLTKVQRVLREFPDTPVMIEGHTDSQGNDDLNQSLSQRRAIAVREYLLANMALSADRITAVGFGESRPVASNQTAEGRAQNRRIDVVLSLSADALITGGG